MPVASNGTVMPNVMNGIRREWPLSMPGESATRQKLSQKTLSWSVLYQTSMRILQCQP